MFCEILAVLQQDKLDSGEVKTLFESRPPHIYFILKRPRIYFEPESFHADEENISINFKVQTKNDTKVCNATSRNLLGTSNLKLKCEYPFTFFEIFDNESGKFLSAGDVTLFLSMVFPELLGSEITNCEVLYIGQSYGVDGSKTALDRLKSHSTLQLIYSEAIKKNPDSEIWFALASFSQYNITLFNNPNRFTSNELRQDEKTFKKTFHHLNQKGINELQAVNFTEAALIRYFQPPYNKEYKDSFPNPTHSSYSECYELDVNSVGFEIDTSDKVYCCFFSQKIAPKPVHMHSFPLHSSDDRKSFFDFSWNGG